MNKNKEERKNEFKVENVFCCFLYRFVFSGYRT